MTKSMPRSWMALRNGRINRLVGDDFVDFLRFSEKILGLLAKLAGINQQNDFFGVFNQPFFKCGLLLKAFAGASL